MLIKGHQIKVPMVLNLILVLFYVTAQVNGVESRKLDETTMPPATNGTDEKCTPCGYSSPPPPPANPPPSPPPPSPKKPPSQYCPPPPSSFIYITGPPGNLYPVDENFSGASHRHHHHRSFAAFFPLLVGVLSMLAFW
ncbi:extensin-like [Gastrolobium bilobum]|uniref:extensin-like n=1 Tax=Gastrolobium bilobum TaxID=150636 RepID=UPI002AB0072F|nr:extensin-like [Gastrolobium bilobum]